MRKNVRLAIVLMLISTIMFFTVSCAKEVLQTQPEATVQPENRIIPDGSAEETKPAEQPPAAAIANEAARAAFFNENIHFEFDSAALSGQALQLLNNKAEYMRLNPEFRVAVQGHCDERGTNAYNMALGERRAESVKKFLVNLGIRADRLNTVSYGKSQPITMGQDEASRARNRRAQFVVN